MIEFFNALSQTEQILAVLAAFFAAWFVAGVFVVMSKGGTASVFPAFISALLVIAIIVI